MAFKLYMYITCEKTFLNISWLLTFWSWRRSLTYFSKILYYIFIYIELLIEKRWVFHIWHVLYLQQNISSMRWFPPFDLIFIKWHMIGMHIWYTICHKLWHPIHLNTESKGPQFFEFACIILIWKHPHIMYIQVFYATPWLGIHVLVFVMSVLHPSICLSIELKEITF